MTIIEGWLLIVDSVSFRLCLSVSFVGQLLAWRFFGGFHSNPFKPIRMHTHTHTLRPIYLVCCLLFETEQRTRKNRFTCHSESVNERMKINVDENEREREREKDQTHNEMD